MLCVALLHLLVHSMRTASASACLSLRQPRRLQCAQPTVKSSRCAVLSVKVLGHTGADALPRMPCVVLLHLHEHRASCKCWCAPGATAASPAAMCATDGKELALCCASVTLSSVCESVEVVRGPGRSVGPCCHRRHMVKDHNYALMLALMVYHTAGQMTQLVERSAAAMEETGYCTQPCRYQWASAVEFAGV